MEVMATLPRYFFSFLLARLYCLPRYPVLWCKLPAEEFPRCAHSSGSSNDRFLRLPSLDFCPRVRLGLVCEWAFFHPRTRTIISMLHSDHPLPQVIFRFLEYFGYFLGLTGISVISKV